MQIALTRYTQASIIQAKIPRNVPNTMVQSLLFPQHHLRAADCMTETFWANKSNLGHKELGVHGIIHSPYRHARS